MTGFGKLYGPAAVITGAAGGIGAGFARVLGSRGFDLVLTDINADGLQRTVHGVMGGVVPVIERSKRSGVPR
jgi:short-subunit dehydrogenase